MNQTHQHTPKRLVRPLFWWLFLMISILLPDPGIVRGDESGKTEAERHDHLIFPEEKEPLETVTIDGVDYPVPAPWIGNKINPPAETLARLRQIPRDLTYNHTEIYLHEKALPPLKAMATAAETEGIALVVHSGYRSAGYQRTIIERLMTRGRTFDDIVRYVAPPGYSEHMLGTVVDFYPSNWTFIEAEAYQWLRRHAAEYGFIETYHQNNLTGHPWEPWHWKYEPAPGVPTLFSDAPIKKGRTEPEASASELSIRPATPAEESTALEDD
jgi:hypothetical protein